MNVKPAIAPKKPKRTRLSADDRQAQILAVASEVFRSRPYGDVSLDEIADRAGVARGLINHHFGTKRDLYLEVAKSTIHAPELPVPDYVQGQTMRQRIELSVGGWLDLIESNRAMWLDSLRTGMGDPEIAELAEQAREKAVDQAVRVMGLGPVEDLTPERRGLMRAWQALAEGAVVQWLMYDRLSRRQVEDLIVESG
ncbi:MAG: TetR/AcrR family transcriptional regulator, partial [Thermoleophilaceae bacterium]|nr:TetR/AcrR family transcriptional regulator [Thermoleophilaceae bacterium]